MGFTERASKLLPVPRVWQGLGAGGSISSTVTWPWGHPAVAGLPEDSTHLQLLAAVRSRVLLVLVKEGYCGAVMVEAQVLPLPGH